MAIRAVIVWMTIVPVAIVNGAVRDLLIAPSAGDPIARALSCLTLSAAVLLIAKLSIGWMGPRSASDAWTIGGVWLTLTLAFEFLVGHYVFGTPWEELAGDYDLLAGRLWVVVLATALCAPRLSLRMPRHFRVPAHVAVFAAVSALAWSSLTPAVSAIAPSGTDDDLVLLNATEVFRQAVDRTAAIPAAVLFSARAIAVFPDAERSGITYRGNGVISARGTSLSQWSPPAMMAFEGSLGLDLESQTADFVLIAQTGRGLDYLTLNRVANPIIVPIVPGALGHNARAQEHADLVAYMHYGDYFAGVTINDWTLGDLTAANARLYGRPYTTLDIVRGAGFFNLPPAARSWRKALSGYFREMS